MGGRIQGGFGPIGVAAATTMPSAAEHDPERRLRAFESAVLPHLDAAQNLARWLTREPTRAEEVLQTACLRALQAFDGFRGDNARAWLLAIVRNTFYSSLRDPEERVSAEAVELDEGAPSMPRAPEPDPETLALLAADARLLQAGLRSLAPVFREAIVLREMEGLSYRDIGEIAGVPIGTVMSRLARARQQLQAFLIARGVAAGGSR